MRQVYLLSFNEDGNSARFRREGWSGQERDIVWSLGHHSTLELPPAPADLAGTLRLQGRVVPHLGPTYNLPRQRLSLRVNDTDCGEISVEIAGPVAFDIPAAALHADRPNILRFHHPDGIAPNVASGRPDFDNRPLAVAWFTIMISAPESVAAGSDRLATVLVTGDHQAARLASLLGRLTVLADRLRFRHVAPAEADAALRDARAEGEVAVWQQAMPATPADDAAELLRFPALRCDLLWPLLAPDPRAVHEPVYRGPRYPMSDRAVIELAPDAAAQADGPLFRAYMARSAAMLTDTPPDLAAELAAWRAREEGCDVKLADRFATLLPEVPLFNAPVDPKAPLMCLLATELLRRTRLIDPARRDAALLEVPAITHNWGGVAWPRQWPIHPEVAHRLALRWYSGETRYIWENNGWTFRDHVLRILRWLPWAP